MDPKRDAHDPIRRRLLVAAAGAGAALVVRPAPAASDDLAATIAAYTRGASVRPGRVTLDIPKLVDNGNAVPVTVSVESPMTAADHVVAVAIFNERNPERDVARCTLGPRAGRARVSTRIRLATSQNVVAIATMSDGSHWSDTVEVVVLLAACVEGVV
jgi:sulfur-oxidizing protein SoxY